jgi:hypothetical protein
VVSDDQPLRFENAGLRRLQELARRGDPNTIRQQIAGSLTPIVRLALRRSQGLPPVVEWVQRTLAGIAGSGSAAPEQYTKTITQLLCNALLRSPADDSSPIRASESMCGA